jgi:hypothetical protein
MKASSSYTIEQIRDKNFLHQYGHNAVDYGLFARFNYVVQPEDGVLQAISFLKSANTTDGQFTGAMRLFPNAKTPTKNELS